ncbi:MAG: YaiI/YqxD family protein [Myxococcota bacterium]
MMIWIDADACPRDVKEVVFKASLKRKLPVTLVANRYQQHPELRWIQFVRVDHGMDVADEHIVQHSTPGDLVITQDVPLAAELVEKGVEALSHRGELWTERNVAERLSVRDAMTELRAMGVMTGGPPAYDNKAKQAFANAFDRWLAKHTG